MKNVYTPTRILISSLLVVFLFLTSQCFAQSYSQTIRGKIIAADTYTPLVGATVSINEMTGTTTDEAGNYRLENVPVGRYTLTISYIGYKKLILPEILVESGKEVIQDIELELNATELDQVVIEASRNNYRISHPVSVKTLTVEETLRFPATFFDPVRLASTFAGVVSQNDQANGISVRGNSPNGISWRLEGMELVNPNHTPNAGTFSDRITQNGGGVNILSAQLLGTSNFYTGAFPSGIGNALSGVLDMQLRNGNNEQHEFTVQAGLIGIDVAAEGPLSKKSGGSYLVNYRYSTIGLLSAMGLDLGDEAITFQDFSFNLNLPIAQNGALKIFGLGGLSENIFDAERDSTLWEFEKDRNDIAFDSKMGAIGTTFKYNFGTHGKIKFGAVISALESNRFSDRLDDQFNPIREDQDIQQRRKTVVYTNYEKNLNARSSLLIGARYFKERSNLDIIRTEFPFPFGEIKFTTLLEGYTNYRSQIGSKLNLNVGLHVTRFQEGDRTYIEPRTSLQYLLNANNRISLAYGLHSQQQPIPLLTNLNAAYEIELGFNRAHHIVLGYKHNFTPTSNIQAELFYQSLFDIPIAGDRVNAFSAINIIEGFYEGVLVNEGTGTNYGLELTYQKYLTNDLYFLLNGTYYDSKYKGSDGVERDTRYNGNYILNFTGGKEWQWLRIKEKKDKQRDVILGVNLRVAYLGGFRDTPIDAAASALANTTIYFEDQAFEIRQDDFFRTDLRLYYKRSKAKSSSTWALDIQNLTNKENAAFSYYDALQNTVVMKYQLGIIPILSYRIEF